MSRWLVLRCILAAALLSVGMAARANAGQAAAGAAQSESIESFGSHGLAVPLPVHITALGAPVVETVTRGGRTTSESEGAARQRAEQLHAIRRRTGAALRDFQRSCDAGAHLLRCGIDSSALGTPPPQS